jgi:hypothetical protein
MPARSAQKESTQFNKIGPAALRTEAVQFNKLAAGVRKFAEHTPVTKDGIAVQAFSQSFFKLFFAKITYGQWKTPLYVKLRVYVPSYF